MLRHNLDKLSPGDYDDEVPESLEPSVLPSTSSSNGNDTSLVDKADSPTGAPKLVPDTSGLPY